MTAYSDFPPAKEYPNFMHNTRIMDYFRAYAKRFDLLKHVNFHHEVLEVRRSPNYDANRKWIVRVKDLNSGEEKEETVEAVMLCSGHHVKPYVPSFKGVDIFRGVVRHSHSYKDEEGFEGKRVIVVGVGNSGCDIAVELSRLSSQVYLATRRGTWLFNRVGDKGYPYDVLLKTRFVQSLKTCFPTAFQAFIEWKLNSRFNHRNYGLHAEHGVFATQQTINDDLPNRIICGSVIVKPNIRELTENGAIFEDGTKVDNVDEVILCTGYSFAFPYLEEGVFSVEENEVELFHWIIPPLHPTLALIGLIQSAIIPIAEMQSRLFSNFLSGATRLPSHDRMKQIIEGKRQAMRRNCVQSRRHTVQVDFIPYMDELAQIIGARPDVLRILLRDPVLGFALIFGPCAAYQYRLTGPGHWSEAREALLSVWDRILFPTRARVSSSLKESNLSLTWTLFGVLLLVIILLFLIN